MNDILFIVGDWPIRVDAALTGFAALALLLLLVIAVVVARSGRRGAELAMMQAVRADELEERLSEMLRAQSEATGRVDAMGQALAGRQADMARAVNERLDSVTHRVGQSMEQTTRSTMDSLRVLHERLGIIDNAHKNLTDLTSQVTTLRDVLANKQSRGAFGQARMEAIVQDGMPKGAYEFQHTLSTGKRPDCVVFLPDQRPLCIDAKFPLEAITALHDARTDEDKKIATQRLRAAPPAGWSTERPACSHDLRRRSHPTRSGRKKSRQTRGQYQVPDQEGQDQREAPHAQQVGAVLGPYGRAQVPRGRGGGRQRERCSAAARRRACARQGGQQGRHPQEPGRQPQVGHHEAGLVPLS